jgi:hypothetical protein
MTERLEAWYSNLTPGEGDLLEALWDTTHEVLQPGHYGDGRATARVFVEQATAWCVSRLHSLGGCREPHTLADVPHLDVPDNAEEDMWDAVIGEASRLALHACSAIDHALPYVITPGNQGHAEIRRHVRIAAHAIRCMVALLPLVSDSGQD